MVSVHSPSSGEATSPDTSGYRAVRRSWAPSVSGDASGRSPKGAQHPVTRLARSSLGGPGMRIAVFGLGYVGTVTAAGLASRGHDVCGVDVDAVKVELHRGRAAAPSSSPGIDELVARGAWRAGASARRPDPPRRSTGADVSLICVGTPSAPQRRHRPALHASARWTTFAPGDASRPRRRRRASTRWWCAAPCRPAPVDDVVDTDVRRRAAARLGTSARRCARSSCARARASPTSSTRRSWWSAPPTPRVRDRGEPSCSPSSTAEPRVVDGRHAPRR